jgi:hypothetical protein
MGPRLRGDDVLKIAVLCEPPISTLSMGPGVRRDDVLRQRAKNQAAASSVSSTDERTR